MPTALPPLTIRIKHARDGSAALTCVRADGSTTWQRQPGQLGAVMPHHDLTHFAVESALGYRHAFYGLVADGWDISDFAAPYARGPIPYEAREVELVVSLFQMDARAAPAYTHEALRELGQTYSSATWPGDRDIRLPVLTDAQIDAVRTLRADLFARWRTVTPGETLELTFARM